MQFKSIIAVLALAVAVVATPVEPVALKLVGRTTPEQPPPPKTPTEICTAKQKVVATCTTLGGSSVSAVQALDTIVSILSGLISILVPVDLKCTLGAVNVLNTNTAFCCNAPQGNTNTQNGNLVALNAQQLVNLNCVNL